MPAFRAAPANSTCRRTTPGRTAAPRSVAPTWSAGPSTLAPLAESIYLLLKLLRDADVPYKVIATHGQFQQTLPQGRSFQLLRLRIDPKLGLIPEISGNRLMVSVRLMRHEADDRLHHSTDDTPFELTLCA